MQKYWDTVCVSRTCQPAHLHTRWAVPRCSAAISALQRGSTRSPSQLRQEVKGMVYNRRAKIYLNLKCVTNISVMEGRRKRYDFQMKSLWVCSVFWSLWLKLQRIKCNSKIMQSNLWRCDETTANCLGSVVWETAASQGSGCLLDRTADCRMPSLAMHTAVIHQRNGLSRVSLGWMYFTQC